MSNKVLNVFLLIIYKEDVGCNDTAGYQDRAA